MCCASREPAQNFAQYIDTQRGTGNYIPITLDQHWNSEHMKSVRRRMMAGEVLPECDVCNSKLLNTDVYRSYFWSMFGHKYDNIQKTTDAEGATTMLPVSWDYRFSNLCNFKCRMCGDMLSSAWESEQRQHNMIDWTNPQNNWMDPAVRKEIAQFQDQQVEAEFAQAVEEHRVEEVYWVGGEPLMYEQHWRYMKRIVELGDGPNVYARYNTNLSRIHYRGVDLFDDILTNLRDWQICASIDGTGPIGEYIRTGLDYSEWRKNYDIAVAASSHRRQVRIDFTLTLPGMFEVENIMQLAQETDTDILAKVVFGFTPEIVMSPLALPRHLLDPWADELITKCSGAMRDILVQLKTRPTFEEQWPDTWQQGLIKGKRRMLQLEKIRNDKFTMADIFSNRSEILKWWNQIDS
jgi:hypothetical protein